MSTSTAESLVNIDPEILGGLPVFRGTRVPIQALFDCLRSGDSLEGFFEGFPSVTPEQAQEALNLAEEALLERYGTRPAP